MRSSFRLITASVVAGTLGWSAVAFADAAGNPASKDMSIAKSTIEKVRAQGFVQCGSASRPGLATVDPKGNWSGLEVEICRAIATAVFGVDGRYAYHQYESRKDYDAARAGTDQVSFLTYTEMSDQNLTDKLLPGPAVFIESHDLIVPVDSAIKHPADLAGIGICFMIASAANNSLEAWYQDHKIEFIPHAYQEDGELNDTYNVQRCKSIVGESTTLASTRRDGGINRLRSRFLPDHLLSFPIVAATPLKEDAQWAAIVAWTIDTVLNADARETSHRPNGLRAMAIDGAGLGLSKDWQKVVVDRVGNYSAIYDRTLGTGSSLKLDQGLNKRVEDGGLLLPPFKQ